MRYMEAILWSMNIILSHVFKHILDLAVAPKFNFVTFFAV